MADKRLSFAHRVDGVLTDAASAVLRNKAGTIGVRRRSTGAAVVAPGTPLVRDGVGLYHYDLTGLDAGAAYEAWFEWSHGGATQWREYVFTAPAAAAGDPLLRHAGWYVLVPPAERVVTWPTLKSHQRIETDAEQAMGEMYIDAATEYAEDRLSASLVERTLLATFYEGVPFVLPRGPVIQVTGVADRDGTAVAGWELSHVGHEARLTLTGDSAGAGRPYSVTYRAGYGAAAAVPADIRVAVLNHAGTLFANRESVSDRERIPVPHSLDEFYQWKSRRAVAG